MTKENNSLDIQKLLSDPKYRLELHKLVQKETDSVYEIIEKSGTQTQNVADTAKKNIAAFEAKSKNLLSMVAYGGYFGTDEQAQLWTSALNRLGTLPHSAGSTILIDLQAYPALLIVYALGIASTAGKIGYNLRALFAANLKRLGHDDQPLISRIHSGLLGMSANAVLDLKDRHTPLSDHLYELMRDQLPKEIWFGQDIEDLFDSWEILLAMLIADIQHEQQSGIWAPIGRFGWRSGHTGKSSIQKIESELAEEADDWFPIKAGLFDSSLLRARKALSVVKGLADRAFF